VVNGGTSLNHVRVLVADNTILYKGVKDNASSGAMTYHIGYSFVAVPACLERMTNRTVALHLGQVRGSAKGFSGE